MHHLTSRIPAGLVITEARRLAVIWQDVSCVCTLMIKLSGTFHLSDTLGPEMNFNDITAAPRVGMSTSVTLLGDEVLCFSYCYCRHQGLLLQFTAEGNAKFQLCLVKIVILSPFKHAGPSPSLTFCLLLPPLPGRTAAITMPHSVMDSDK